jgi:peptidyl-prolyl cis-trans isomerase B (cyclophilin B)
LQFQSCSVAVPNPVQFTKLEIQLSSLFHTADHSPMTKFATIETNKGTMRAELFEKEAPNTVANFEKLANSGFYDGTKFHRVIKDFVVQGGDPYSKGGEHAKGPVGTGGPGYKIDCETKGNPHTHQVGALSMAHAGKNTGGSQFFIVLNEQNS